MTGRMRLSALLFVALVVVGCADEDARSGIARLENMQAPVASNVSKLEQRTKALESRLTAIEWDQALSPPTPEQVDLTSVGLQRIDPDFLVAKLDLRPHMTGVKVSGVVINSTSLEYQASSFKFTIGKSANTFQISRIRAGASARFEVYVPDVAAAETKVGQVTYESGQISYLAP